MKPVNLNNPFIALKNFIRRKLVLFIYPALNEIISKNVEAARRNVIERKKRLEIK